MTGLKTLKDLKEWQSNKEQYCKEPKGFKQRFDSRTTVDKDELRQVAREWKHICFEDWFYEYKFKCEKCEHTKMEWDFEGDYCCCKCGFLYNPIYLWIKHFFNLEDEDD